MSHSRMDRWRGRVAVVTGASSGIGAAIVKMLSINGVKVVGCARRVDKIKDMGLENVWAYKCDLKNEAEITKMFEWIEEEAGLGRVDVCVANAGFNVKASLLQGSVQTWKDMLDVNVIALCLCTQLTLKSMIKHKINDGRIILVSSFSGHRVVNSPTTHFYAATKFAVRGLLEGWRQEIRDLGDTDIGISCLSPGMVSTEFGGEPAELRESRPHLEAEDMAEHVRHIMELDKRVQIHDILVRPTRQLT